MQLARARVDGELTVADLGPPEIERLRRELSFPNPKFVQAIRLNRQTSEPDRLCAVREHANGNISVPRGAVLEVRRVLRERGFDLHVMRDERVRSQVSYPELRFDLRDYQLEGVTRLCGHTQGVITYPCGGGKTSTGIGIMAATLQRALVLVHTDDLLEQWLEALEEKIFMRGGMVRGGKPIDWQPVTIASVHKLRRMLDDEETLAELRRFGLLIVDEAHHAPAETFTQVIRHVPAFYRVGLTATPEREDGLTPLVGWTFGDTISERSVSDLVRAGFLELPQGWAVHTGLEYEYTGGRDDKKNEATARAVYNNKKRNALVARYAKRCFDDGAVTLVLTSRLAHLKRLGKAMEDIGLDPILLSGKSKRADRLAGIERMREGEPVVVVAMPIFDEGVDVPALGALLLAFPERAKGRTIQRAGRLMRPFKGVTPKLFDFVDDKVDLLAGRWGERRRVFEKMGIEMQHVIEGGDDGST